MPTVNASKNILNAGANYAAGDWANVGAEASLDFKAQAQLLRGVDLGVGAEAGVRLEGGLHKYLSADVQGQANAAAQVRAQIQVPLDLFAEAGLAIRLQAIAEAAAGVTLGVGLKAGDFLALARQDPHMRGVPFELLKVFLHELEIQGGVMAKAAAAAMAYANLAVTGRLIRSGTDLPGFTVAAEAGVGLKAGAGFKVFARFKVADPRRLIRRSVDVAVDGGIEPLLTAIPEGSARVALNELRTPAKIALRAAFEVGMTLSENQGAFNAGDKDKIALRCVQVALEEAQRCVLEHAVEFASGQLRSALSDLGFSNATWASASAARRTLADRLRALPEEPFEDTQTNRDYWAAVSNEVIAVAGRLAGGAALPPSLAAPLSLLWGGTQLLFISVRRISEAQARGSILGMSHAQATVPFSGNMPQPQHAAISDHINAALGRNSAAAITQADVVKFIVLAIQGGPLLDIAPEITEVLKIVAGADGGSAADALDIVFSNLGAFVPAADGTVSAQSTLAVLRDGLRAYLDTRIEGELRTALQGAAGSNRDLQTFLDEVVISTLHTVVGPVFDTVLAWGQGDQDGQRALRELCSSLILRLLGRSLIVVSDVLLAKAQESIQTELRQLAAHVDDANGIATTLARLTRLDREFVSEVVEETLLICADTFGPMPEERRAHVRALLYQIIDTAPAPDNADAVTDLRDAAMVPNLEAATELAMLLGEEIVGNIVRFIQALLTRVGALILEELQEIIVSIQKAVEEWVEELQQLAQQLTRRLAELVDEIDRLGREIEDAGDALLEGASNLLGFIADHSGSRTKLRDELAALAADKAVGLLKGHDLYPGLPREARKWARDRVREIVASLLDNRLFDPVLDAVSQIADETADFLDDVRAIEPGDDVPEAIADLFLDRFEDAIRDVFGHDNPRMEISLTVPFVNVHIGFGVSLPLGGIVSSLRGAIRDMGRFNAGVAALSGALITLIAKENALVAATDEHAALDAQRQTTDQRLAEAREPTPELTILSPQPGAALERDVVLVIRAEGVSKSYLGIDDGEQQRLFVWVNQRELPVELLDVTALSAGGTLQGRGGAFELPDAVGALHPLVGLRAVIQDRDRSKRSAKLSRTQGANRRAAIQAGLLGRPGVLQRRGDKTTAAKPSKGSVFLPGRTFDLRHEVPAAQPARAGLRLTALIPTEFLHEGINTIACLIVPGSAARRVEQAVSFLLTTAKRPARGGGITMPGRLVWNKDALHPNVQQALTRQFGPGRVAPERASKTGLDALAQQLWFPRKAAREAVVEQTAARIKSALPVERERTALIRQTVVRRGFRPVIQRPAETAADGRRKTRVKEPR